jgi:hypothetical protein
MSGVDPTGKSSKSNASRAAAAADFLYQIRRVPGMTLIVSEVTGFFRHGSSEPLTIDHAALQKIRGLLETKYSQTVGTKRAAAEDLAYLALRLQQQGSTSAARALASIAKPIIDQMAKIQKRSAMAAQINMDSFI